MKKDDDSILDSETVGDEQEPLSNFQKPASEDEVPRPARRRKKAGDDPEIDGEEEEVEIDARSDGRRYFEGMKPKVKKYLKKLGDETKELRDIMMDANKKYTAARDGLIDAMLKEGLTEYELDSGETVRVTESHGLKITKAPSDIETVD